MVQLHDMILTVVARTLARDYKMTFGTEIDVAAATITSKIEEALDGEITSLRATQAQAIADRDLAWRRLTALATAARAARDWMQHDLEDMAGCLVVPTPEEQPLAQIIAKIDPNDPGFPMVAELRQLLDGLDIALSECPT